VTLALTESLDMADTWVGLPVAVVIVLLALAGWRLLSTGALITGEQHRAVTAELREQIETAERHRAEALVEVARWQQTTLRLLNVSEAVARKVDQEA
jgi:hypothetical protein